jgi:hypothetical protein
MITKNNDTKNTHDERSCIALSNNALLYVPDDENNCIYIFNPMSGELIQHLVNLVIIIVNSMLRVIFSFMIMFV